MDSRRQFLSRAGRCAILAATAGTRRVLAANAPSPAAPPGMTSLTGDASSVGRQIGTLNGAQIRAHVAAVFESWKKRKLPEQAITQRSAPLRRFIDKFAPAWMEEIEATAAAAGIPGREYLGYLAGKYRDLFFVDECTSFFAVGAATADGATLFHKNRDNVAREQNAFHKRVLHISRPAAFFSTGDTSDLGLMMMVNEHGLAGSADTGGLREDRPKGRGVANPYILRLIAERAECCRHALEIIQQMIRDGWYAGGPKTGTNWHFADRCGTGLRVAQNAHEEQHCWFRDSLIFSVRGQTPAAQSLLGRWGSITLSDMNTAAQDPDITFKSSISAMTVRIDPNRPAETSSVWFALPAWNVYLPLFWPAACAPRELVDGSCYQAGYKLLQTAKTERKRTLFSAALRDARRRCQESLYTRAGEIEQAICSAIGRNAGDEAARIAAQGSAECCARVMRLFQTGELHGRPQW